MLWSHRTKPALIFALSLFLLFFFFFTEHAEKKSSNMTHQLFQQCNSTCLSANRHVTFSFLTVICLLKYSRKTFPLTKKKKKHPQRRNQPETGTK